MAAGCGQHMEVVKMVKLSSGHSVNIQRLHGKEKPPAECLPILITILYYSNIPQVVHTQEVRT